MTRSQSVPGTEERDECDLGLFCATDHAVTRSAVLAFFGIRHRDP